MVMWTNLPKEALDDCFRPPDQPCQVQCLHCGHQYSSADIVWCETEDGGWQCPIEDCDGAGFQFDIHQVDSTLWGGSEYDEDEDVCDFDVDDEDMDFTEAFEDDDLPF